ncbi:MAG: DnaJ domain-containing protein [Planctomycetes bacterium]|nr:DnaJ domain-containing protein [Planctomycetota bacterium]
MSDLSAAGMRVHTAARPKVRIGTVLALWVRSGVQQVAVYGRVVRLRRMGWREWDMGVRFIDPTPGQVSAMLAMAHFGYVPAGEHRFKEAGGPPPPPPQTPAVVDFGLPDHYRTLGLNPDATPERIHHVYRELARLCHPDLNKSAEATQRFIEISRAYEVLHDPEARKKYDSQRRLTTRRAATGAHHM